MHFRQEQKKYSTFKETKRSSHILNTAWYFKKFVYDNLRQPYLEIGNKSNPDQKE
jgi:hypothetical protein